MTSLRAVYMGDIPISEVDKEISSRLADVRELEERLLSSLVGLVNSD